MEFNRANKLYCLGNKNEDINQESVEIGVLKSTKTYSSYFHAHNQVVETEDVSNWSAEKSLLFLFSNLDTHFEVIDTYINITEHELTFARLAIERERFCFLDSNEKFRAINNLALKVNNELLLIQIATADQLDQYLKEFEKNKSIYLHQLNQFCLH